MRGVRAVALEGAFRFIQRTVVPRRLAVGLALLDEHEARLQRLARTHAHHELRVPEGAQMKSKYLSMYLKDVEGALMDSSFRIMTAACLRTWNVSFLSHSSAGLTW